MSRKSSETGKRRLLSPQSLDRWCRSRVPAAAAVTLASGTAFSSQAGIGAISAIENVIGRQGNNVLTGNRDDNVLKLSNKLAK